MTNFVILSQQRSGSHMLMNLLNSHPNVNCNSDSQTYDINKNGEEWAYDSGFEFDSSKNIIANGFLLKIKTGLHETISLRSGLKIIYLVRRNKLEILLSKKMAKRYGCYEKKADGIYLSNASEARSLTEPIHISIDDLNNFEDEWATKHKEVRRSLIGTDSIKIFYNELCNNKQNETGRIFDFLGLPSVSVEFQSGRGETKLDKRLVEDSISNYLELKNHFTEAPIRRYFK